MEELLASVNYQIPTVRRGQDVSGRVVLVTKQELLVDIGAKSEGIISGKEFTQARDITSKINVGDTIEATVIYPENDAGQVVLSLRKLSGEKRWEELDAKNKSSEEVEVFALEANRGGLICDFLGLRGFLPASQLTHSTGSGQAKAPSKLDDLVGRSLLVRVIEVDKASNRLIFSQKRPGRGDLENVVRLLTKIKIGQKFSGIVTAVLPFGIFVEIQVGGAGPVTIFPPASARSSKNKSDADSETSELRAVGSPSNRATRIGTTRVAGDTLDTTGPSKLEGLVHISEVSWEKVDDLNKLFKVGDAVSVMVIAKDATVGRLNLSIKQLTSDPFLRASEKYSRDQKVAGRVSKATAYGVFVTLEDGLEGLIHISKIPPNVSFKDGEEIECEIESVDSANRRISLVPIIREKPILYR